MHQLDIIQNNVDVVQKDVQDLKKMFASFGANTAAPAIEIIDRAELQRRLGVAEPTVIRYEKRGIIPRIEMGGSVRYNWPAVVEALSNPSK